MSADRTTGGGHGDEPARLVLPHEDAERWASIVAVLRRPLTRLDELDAVLTEFAAGVTDQRSTFFATVPAQSSFDFEAFWLHGVPFLLAVAVDLPTLFPRSADGSPYVLPLLLRQQPAAAAGGAAVAPPLARTVVTLTRRQVACLLAHSVLGSITADARRVRKEKWAFRAAQLFFLDARPSALCVLTYFTRLGRGGVPAGDVTYERIGFARAAPPWSWTDDARPLCAVAFDERGRIERSSCTHHADFANRFVGGGCLENDFNMEEILFAVKPELIVAMALCSYMHDEESVRVRGALQYCQYSGYASTFAYAGEFDGHGDASSQPPAVVCAMDALQGAKMIQFGAGLVLRDLNKARVAFDGATTIATGNWGCGAFGNDHQLKFVQQWLAASAVGAERVHYHTAGDRRAAPLPALYDALRRRHGTVAELYATVMAAAAHCEPGPRAAAVFHRELAAAAAAAASADDGDD